MAKSGEQQKSAPSRRRRWKAVREHVRRRELEYAIGVTALLVVEIMILGGHPLLLAIALAVWWVTVWLRRRRR